MAYFFFSSRRRHTRWNCDWSSDVCSSDLVPGGGHAELVVDRLLFPAGKLPPLLLEGEQRVFLGREGRGTFHASILTAATDSFSEHVTAEIPVRSEERRVGKECRARWSLCH